MLSRKHRFHGYNSLNHVYRSGSTRRTPVLLLRYCAQPARPTYRVAVVVSKKINKSAVARNRMRRRIFEAVRLQESSIHESLDLVFTVLDGKLESASTAEIYQTVSRLLAAVK